MQGAGATDDQIASCIRGGDFEYGEAGVLVPRGDASALAAASARFGAPIHALGGIDLRLCGLDLRAGRLEGAAVLIRRLVAVV